MFGYPCFTLKKRPKVKSDNTKRFPAHDFLYVSIPSQTSRTNNKQVISTFMFGYTHLTLNEGHKVKSDHTRRFSAHDFLHVGIPSQSSKTNNKRVINTFKFGYACLTLNERPRSNQTTPEDSQHMISYMLVYHPKALGPIINEL